MGGGDFDRLTPLGTVGNRAAKSGFRFTIRNPRNMPTASAAIMPQRMVRLRIVESVVHVAAMVFGRSIRMLVD